MHENFASESKREDTREMKIKKVDMSYSEGEPVAVVFGSNLNQLLDLTTPCEVDVAPRKGKRSLDANSYMWALADKLAKKLLTTKEEVYRELIWSVGAFQDVAVTEDAAKEFVETWQSKGTGWIAEQHDSKLKGCTKVRCYKGSSAYNTAQMSRLIDELITECKGQNIETMTPHELEKLKKQWR